MKRLIDVDPLTGIETWHHFDTTTGLTTIETVQDVEPYLEYNKFRRNDDDYKKQGMKNEFWHVARIPIVVQEQWLREGIDIYNKDHWPKVRQKLNDPDWANLRTSRGRI